MVSEPEPNNELQFIGAQCFKRWRVGKEQRRNGDEPDAAGDERSCDQYQKGFCGYAEHRCRVLRWRDQAFDHSEPVCAI